MMSVALRDIQAGQGPIRIADWDWHRAWVEEHRWQIPEDVPYRLNLPAGWVVVRDIRTYHSGTENSTNTDRHMPGFVVASDEMMAAGHGTKQSYRPKRTLIRQIYDSELSTSRLGGGHCDYISKW